MRRPFSFPLIALLTLVLAAIACGASPTSAPREATTEIAATPTPEPTVTPILSPTPKPAPTATAKPAPGVAIVQIFNEGYAEHVVIRNQGAGPADLSGWALRESDGAKFVFPAGFSLGPGDEVRVYSGRDGRQSKPPAALDWTEKNVWANDGETARLYDSSGALVFEFHY